jgi:hypothetical protein
MTSELELERRDYHLHLMIERMQRDGRSEDAIEGAIRIASDSKPPASPATSRKNPRNRRRGFNR